MSEYLRPTDLDETLQALGSKRWVVLAGGTDFYPARVGRPLDDDVLDITALALRGIEDRTDHYHIGSLTTWTDLMRADLPPWFLGLKLAAREIGGVQIQNAGTLCGNVCNASPAADGVPNLLALEARVEVASRTGMRSVSIDEFITGNRRTTLQPDELVTGLTIPKPKRVAVANFLKLGARKYLVISIAMVAIVVEVEPDETIAGARVAVGSCSVVALRLGELEAALVGRSLSEPLGGVVRPEHLAPLSPIDDVRGSAEYRREAALSLVRRALDGLGAVQ